MAIPIHSLPAHVLANNPDLAKLAKKSRSKTPSGKGFGFTDDEQAYNVAPMTAAQLCAINASIGYNNLHNTAQMAELEQTHPEAYDRLLFVLAGLRSLRESLAVRP